MSSHHFVREGQEPALYIVDPLSLALVEPLLEWAPLVIVSGNALADVLKWKIKIDVVLLPKGVVADQADAVANQGPLEILFYQNEANIPDLLVTFLKQQKCSGMHIVTRPAPDVFDRWISKINELAISIIDAEAKWSAVQSTFQKWLPAKTRLSIALTRHSSCDYTGLRRMDDQSFLTEKNGAITIQSDSPFWVGESLEN